MDIERKGGLPPGRVVNEPVRYLKNVGVEPPMETEKPWGYDDPAGLFKFPGGKSWFEKHYKHASIEPEAETEE